MSSLPCRSFSSAPSVVPPGVRGLALLCLLLAAPLLSTLPGCPPATTTDPGPDPITGIPNLPSGNPIVPDAAMLPFPSDLYLVDDASTRTGRRVSYPAEVMPEGVSPEVALGTDGFSRATPILTLLQGGVDPDSLPPWDDPGVSVTLESPVLLVRADTWELVPILVELDGNTEDLDEQTLIIRPHTTLAANTGHVVLIRDGLRAADGGAHEPELAFRALRDELLTDDSVVEGMRASFATVLAAIENLGLEREEVIQGWSFHTASQNSVIGPLLHMQDVVMDAELGELLFHSDEYDDDGRQRIIRGSFEAPNFLDQDLHLSLDPAGMPRVVNQAPVEFQLTIPAGIDEPRPVMVYGHGFFSSLEEPTWGSLKDGLERWRMSAATTNFLGFNEDDVFDTFQVFGGDLVEFRRVTNQQLQSLANQTALARLVREELAGSISRLVDEEGVLLLDGDRMPYMGISNGGTQGLTLMATSPFFERGVLVVPGGGWSHMLQRATQWNTLGSLFVARYPDPLEMQLVMALMQSVLDPADSTNYVDILLRNRPEGRPEVSVTLHEAVGDTQVSNYVTEWIARAAGIPLVTPSAREIWGMETVEAPPETGAASSSGLLVYDENYPPVPPGNIPPAVENGAHDSVRRLEAYFQQVGEYLETGRIIQVCDEDGCNPD